MDQETRSLAELLRASAAIGKGFAKGSLLSALAEEYKPPPEDVARYAEAYLLLQAMKSSKPEPPLVQFTRCLLRQIGGAR